MAPTKPRLMTLEFVSVTLEIWVGGAYPGWIVLSHRVTSSCLSCNQGRPGTSKARREQLNNGVLQTSSFV